MKHAWLLVSSVLAQGCLFDGELKRDNGTIPKQLDDGWEIATPKSVGLSTKTLNAIHAELLREDRHRAALSLLVIKDGKLVFETYLRRPQDRDHYRHIQSATKSVTSLLVGIAKDQGKFGELDQSVGALFPKDAKGLAAKRRAISVHDLLTMSSGLSFDNEVFSVEMWVDKPAAPIRYMLSKPLYADPGEEFYYRDVDPQIVGYALASKVGKSEREFADETLFRALDIHDYYWDSGADGVSMAAHGLHLLPRDLAKLGQLALQRGMWNDEQVVSEAWLEQSTALQIESDVTRDGAPLPYGYYWWVVPGVGYSMWGHGGQFVLVVPARDMVLVQTAFPDSDQPDSDLNSFVKLVEPLLEDR